MSAAISVDLPPGLYRTRLTVEAYDLAATLDSGQAFRWQTAGNSWQGVVGSRWVTLQATPAGIEVTTATDPGDWQWIRDYLQVGVDLQPVLAALPSDPPLQAAVKACRGLRLLRQDPWECLASFILSSTKQIVQIRQIIRLLAERWGEAVPSGDGRRAHAFPSAQRVASLTERQLRDCRMGFRAPYLHAAARRVVDGGIDLDTLANRPLAEAREALLQFKGVGRKIADCVLLFAFGFEEAFPIDVWIARVLREWYFGGRDIPEGEVRRFVESHFGPRAGWAQQYLFHYARLQFDRRSRTLPGAI